MSYTIVMTEKSFHDDLGITSSNIGNSISAKEQTRRKATYIRPFPDLAMWDPCALGCLFLFPWMPYMLSSQDLGIYDIVLLKLLEKT